MARTSAPFTTQELQTAAQALIQGKFRGEAPSPGLGFVGKTSVGAQEGSAKVAAPSCGVGAAVADFGESVVVRVRPCSSGAGASTTALGLADRAEATGRRVRVVDAATPAWSGLVGASMTELGARQGWRLGRRDTILLDRVEHEVLTPDSVPAPRPVEGIDLTILDVGWSARELMACDSAWVSRAPVAVEVLVTRASPMALSQTEAVLRCLPDEAIARNKAAVVVVGPSRWSAKEFGAAGPLLNRVRESDAVLFAPAVALRSLPELGPQALPKQLITSSKRLLERLDIMTGSALRAGSKKE